jgi:phosphatidylglycerophosphate synthase
MERQQFAGASKFSSSFVSPLEQRLASIMLPKIPTWLETYHLTLVSLVWCALIIAFSYVAANKGDLRWLWGVSLMIALQWATDFFDGKVGKYRNTGLVKWGFYMDHLFDYVFFCSLVIGYALILPERSRYLMMFILATFGGFMVNSFLDFAATGKFKISYLKFGPTEFRVSLIIINTLLIAFGTRRMVKALPYVAAGALIGLCVLVYRTQKNIWKIDMDSKNQERV